MKWIVIAALLVAGCKKKHEEPVAVPPPAVTGSAAMTGSAPAPEPVATGSATAAAVAVDVPTEQDFEEKAAKDIDAKNVDGKLKTLENDLAPH